MKSNGGEFAISHNMKEAFDGADIVYPKSWCSLLHLPQKAGDPVNEVEMNALFEKNKEGWICDQETMLCAKPTAAYMHCLPCDRGQEVTDEVIDGSQSAAFHQAENRLHSHNAILAHLLAES